VAAALAALLLLGAAATARPAGAAEVVLYEDVPSARELNCVLFARCTRSLAAPAASRSVRFKDEASAAAPPRPAATVTAAAAASPAPATADEPAGTVLGLNILFAYDSTEILAESRPYLERLGEVLREPGNAGARIAVVGHTDATGPDDYNLELSRRRARAVEAYLAGSHGVDPGRLGVRGMGEGRPLPGLDGLDPRNRRVEFYAQK
jgi:outer membrane protein OmpA-like peptidoglycan-associated protein